MVCADGHPGAIRVAYLDSTAEMGGAEHLLLTLLEALPRDQVKAHLLCGEDGPLVTRATQLGIDVQIVKGPRLLSLSRRLGALKIIDPLAILWNACALLIRAIRNARAIRPLKPDLIQTNTVFSHLYGGLAARMLGIPCIWYFHDLVETERLGGLTQRVWQLLARALATRVVAVSHAVEQALALGDQCLVIYAGVRLPGPMKSRALRERLGLPTDAPLVGYVGRIAQCKGLDVLAYAAKLVLETMPEAQFVILGAPLFGQETVQRSLQALIETLGVADHWHWLGYDPHARAAMQEFDVLVLPSRREALPLVLVEAGLAGVPVVATRVGGIPEVVEDGVTGLLVKAEDARLLAQAVLDVLSHTRPKEWRPGQVAALYERRFGITRYAHEFGELYGELGL